MGLSPLALCTKSGDTDNERLAATRIDDSPGLLLQRPAGDDAVGIDFPTTAQAKEIARHRLLGWAGGELGVELAKKSAS